MKLYLSLNGKVTILTLLVLPLLLSLGQWQLERVSEKREIELQFLTRQQQPAVSIEELDPQDDLAFTPVRLQGSFDKSRQFLLDNRTQGGQLGYEVLQPFLTSQGSWVLVNRGWIAGHIDRRTLPPIPPVEGDLLTHGSIYVSPGKPFLLKEQIIEKPSWPLVIQAVELDKLASVMGQTFFPYVVRLDAGANGALRVDWQPMNQEPAKHTAYAVQWFTMAVALVLWFGFANTNMRQFAQYYWNKRKAEQNDSG